VRYQSAELVETRPSCDYEAVQHDLHQALDQVVAEHMDADVPLALLLSGGLDSSLLAAYASRHGHVRTLTFSFPGSTVDERAHVRTVSEFLHTEHDEVVLSAQDVLAGLDEGVRCADDLIRGLGHFYHPPAVPALPATGYQGCPCRRRCG
jgi:asparagine synthetase B (glutamine-hydrolysing)